MIVQKFFGDNHLLYAIHGYKKEYGMNPCDWRDLFEFLNVQKTTAELHQYARRVADAKARAAKAGK